MKQNQKEGKNDNRHPIIRITEKFGDLFFLNIIFILSCIPVITIGAALVSLYYMTHKMVNNEEEGIWKGYWKAFYKNFVIGTQILLVTVLFFITLYHEYTCLDRFNTSVTMILIVIMGFELIVFCLIFPMIFPLAARYDNKLFKHIANSFVIALSHLNIWFILFATWFIPIFIMLFQPNIFIYTWYLWPLILLALGAYGSSLAMQKLFQSLEDSANE